MKVESNVSCRDFIERVTDYLERRTGHEEHAILEQHLLICVGCARYVEGIECTTAIARQLGDGAGSPETEKPLAAFRAFKAKRRKEP
jgi:hypothetical protein